MNAVNDQVAVAASSGGAVTERTPSTTKTSVLSPVNAAGIVALITLMGAAVRFYRLGGRSLWIDEAASAYFAAMNWRPFLRLLWGLSGQHERGTTSCCGPGCTWATASL